MFLAVLFWTAAFHIAGKYSRIISPFLFTQILWASLFGNIFFSESLDTLSIFGISLIILSGTILLYKTYTKNIS
jgi:drug/metabolite transporter (DMT)-like permease